ncbi:MAG: YIP1 family protein [Nanoarchaeota archaeon]|nr:YIP1 family protein [Nanoarchaeota archaeon]
MSFVLSLKRAFRMFKLDEKAMIELSKENHASWYGLLIIAIAGVCFGLSLIFVDTTLSILTVIGAPILMIITSFIGIAVLFILSKLLGGKGNFHNFYRAYSHMYVFNWIAIIPWIGPFLSSLVGVWQVIMAIYITKATQKLTMGKAAIVVLVPVFVLLLLAVFTSLVVALTLFLKYSYTLVQPGV